MPNVDLEQSLRTAVDGHIERRLERAREEIERLRGHLDEALTRLSGGDASAGDASLSVTVADHLRNARNQGIEEAAAGSTRARASSDVAIIKAAIDDLEERRTQSDLLSALVNRAASFAPRVAFFVVRNERVTGWRARGLEGTVGDDSVREISLPVSSDTLIGEVARTRRTWSGAPGTHAEDDSIYKHFGDEVPQRTVAIPLVAREKAVAVLYADSAGQDLDAINLEALETLVRVTGMAVELLALRRPPQASASAPEPAAAASPHAESAAPAREEEPQPQAPAFMESDSSTAFAAEPVAAEPEPTSFEMTPAPPAPATFEEMDAQASIISEPPPPPTFESAPAEAVTPVEADAWTGRMDNVGEPSFAEAAQPQPEPTPATPRRRYGSADTALPIEVGDDERPLHDKAWRFARLLVSEIKLYNEEKVKEGREAGDLYPRLREHIDRSREMYNERYAHQIGGRFDYFHHALVNTLAEGDASKLGAGYPGASVPV